MKQNYKDAIDFILKWEGGYVDHPKDPGGATNHGITLKTARAFWKADATKDDLKSIPMAVVHDIYRKNYADKVDFDKLPSGLDLCAFDAAVLSGPAKAKAWLKDTKTIGEYQGKRLAFYQSLNTWTTFGRGWTRRVDAGTKEASRLATPEATNIKKIGAAIAIGGPVATQIPGLPTSVVPVEAVNWPIVIGIAVIAIGIGLYIYSRYKKYKKLKELT